MKFLHTTLDALKLQLEADKHAQLEYSDNVCKKQVEGLNKKIASWFLKELGISNEIHFSGENLRLIVIPGTSVEIYLRIPWRDYEKDTVKPKIELNWYGSSCRVGEDKHTQYLAVLGKIAPHLQKIEDECRLWYLEYEGYRKGLVPFSTKVRETENAIRDTERVIKAQDIELYKRVGFKCDLKNDTDTRRNYKFKEYKKHIKLYYGYGKHDYIQINSFEILMDLKWGKLRIKYKNEYHGQNEESFSTVDVTPKFFVPFIQEVYDWQTCGADEKRKREILRLEMYN